MLQGSNRDGLLPVKAAEGAGALEAHLCNTPYPWATGNYEAGDVITFSSLTVHKSLPNQLGNKVRLSCDYRFQPANEDIEEKSLSVHMNLLPWEEIYAGWENNEDLKYYWKRHDLSFSPWDESIRWQKRQIC